MTFFKKNFYKYLCIQKTKLFYDDITSDIVSVNNSEFY